jgi:small subunit ribosomal protein S14
MATKAKIATNEKRKKLCAKYASKRTELKAIIAAPHTTQAEKLDAQTKLNALPRNSSRTRIRNRCAASGRARSVYRKFGLSRIALREHGLAGEIPGLTKSSW